MATRHAHDPLHRDHEHATAAALAGLSEALDLATDLEKIGRIIDRTDEIIADSDGETRERAEAFAAKAEARRQRMILRGSQVAARVR